MAAAVVDGWAPVLNAASSPDASAQQTPSGAQQKKPRHRHTPEQLAALNELFAKNEHPSLEERTALAERLGMCVSSSSPLDFSQSLPSRLPGLTLCPSSRRSFLPPKK